MCFRFCYVTFFNFLGMNSKSEFERACKWLLSGETGSSSETICAIMTGNIPVYKSVPSDSSDFGRCYTLLKLIPEWIDRLGELKEIDYSCKVNGGSSCKGGWDEENVWSTFVNNFFKWSELYEKGELTYEIMRNDYTTKRFSDK